MNKMLDRMPPPAPPVVLIVEDEWLLRGLAVEFVEDAGFVVLEARDADEAAALLETRSDIDLLFTDIDMPGSMDGLKLAHTVRDRWPLIKILITSGQRRPELSDLPLNSVFLGKPYRCKTAIAQLHLLVGRTGASISPMTDDAWVRL
jgi:CheY-like chemotaxis protein